MMNRQLISDTTVLVAVPVALPHRLVPAPLGTDVTPTRRSKVSGYIESLPARVRNAGLRLVITLLTRCMR